MRGTGWLWLSLIGFGSGAHAAPVAEPHKYALVVTISEYPELSGYKSLHTENDGVLIEAALKRQGFAKGDVTRLSDAAATRDGIVEAIEAVTAKAGPGDVVVLHYSGHGHQITDDDGDEIDGYDEVLVPYGAPTSMQGYDGGKHLRDDDLGALIDALRRKVGASGSVLVTLDACHSGSATRGADDELAVRGGMAPIGAPGKARKGIVEAGGMFEGSGAPAPVVAAAGSSIGMAPFVVISAARHDEVARETRDGKGTPTGALSLALSESLTQGKKGMTYRQLFAKMQAQMSTSVPKQTPQLEGDVDAIVLSDQIVEQKPYFTVEEVKEGGVVRIDGGRLVGLLPGTVVAFHPAGTLDPAASKAIATGVIGKASEVVADVTVTGPAEKLKDSLVFVTQYSFGDLEVKVAVDPGVGKEAGVALAGAPVAKIVESGADLRVIATDKGKVQLVTADGTVVGGPWATAEAAFAGKLQQAVKDYARNRYLKGLDLHDDGVDVILELVPSKHTYDDMDGSCLGSVPVDRAPYESAGAGWTFQPGDQYLLAFENTGTTPVYVSVLDLMPDGQIAQLFPAPGRRGTDNLVGPGQRFVATDLCFEVTEPYGTEMLKLFATREKVDFEPILTSGGATRGAGGNPLEAVLADAMTGTRGAKAAVPRQSGSTTSLMLQVVEKRE